MENLYPAPDKHEPSDKDRQTSSYEQDWTEQTDYDALVADTNDTHDIDDGLLGEGEVETIPVPSHLPSVYHVTEYRYTPPADQADEPSDALPRPSLPIVDINAVHELAENAVPITEVVKAYGCGVVALEVSDLTEELVATSEDMFNNVTDSASTAEDLAHFTENAVPGFATSLIQGLHATGIRVKIIDSPANLDARATGEEARVQEEAGLAALAEFDIPRARQAFDAAASQQAEGLARRDKAMAEQITAIADTTIREGDTRPVAAIKGMSHYRTLGMVPGATGQPDAAQIESLRPETKPLNWAVQAHLSQATPEQITEAHDRAIISRYFLGFFKQPLQITAAAANEAASTMPPEQVAAVMQTIEEITTYPGATPQQIVRAVGGLLHATLQELLQKRQK